MTKGNKAEDCRFEASTFIGAANKGMEDLKKMAIFIEKIEKNPELLITSFAEHLETEIKFVYSPAANRYVHGNTKLRSDDFPKYIFNRAFNGFRQLMKKEGLGDDFEITINAYTTLPTKFILLYKGDIICRIDIYDKLYGCLPRSKKDYLENEVARKYEYIKKMKKDIEYYENIYKNPFKKICTFTDLFILAFKRKQLNDVINNKLKTLKQNLESEQNSINKLQTDFSNVDKAEEEKNRGVETVERVLSKYGYTYAEENHLFY